MSYEIKFTDPLSLSQGETPDRLNIEISLKEILDFSKMTDLLVDEQLNTDIPIPR